jgi:hypothetical protein
MSPVNALLLPKSKGKRGVSIWFRRQAPDNDSNMCGSTDRLFDGLNGLAVCAKCGYKTDPFYINPAFRVKRRVYDVSYTYDGYQIVSRKFKEACLRAKLTGVGFQELPADSEFFHLKPTAVVSFDGERSHTSFLRRCPACSHFRDIVGLNPACLKSAPTTDLSRTDLLFGSGNEMHPLIILSETAKDVIQRERLIGIRFDSVRV